LSLTVPAIRAGVEPQSCAIQVVLSTVVSQMGFSLTSAFYFTAIIVGTSIRRGVARQTVGPQAGHHRLHAANQPSSRAFRP
jgi:hypothetical protein